ncbi:Type II secretion system protein D [bacterium HR15]|nr:Type II secretion system protein D [bacterium HR15]
MRRKCVLLWSLTWILLLPVYAQLDLELDGIPLGVALQIIARQANVNLMLAGGDDLKVTAHLKGVSVEQALEVMLKPLGLAFRKVQGCYVVGKPEQLAIWDVPATPPAPVKQEPPIVEVYEVRFVNPLRLLQTLSLLHPEVRVLPGVPPLAPVLGGSDTSGSGTASAGEEGAQGMPVGLSQGTEGNAPREGTQPASMPSNIRTLLLYGTPQHVQAALKTAQRLDQPPMQIRIEVIVTDISRNSLKELGLDYNWSKFGVQEIVRPGEQASVANETLLTPPDKSRFWRTPLSIEATLKAMEQRGVAKLLANPSVSVLNGEMAQVLIGDRILYPVVSGTTTAGTPLFDVREQEVGIVLQVRAYAEPGGTITLDIYPQVSIITGFLRVGDSSFPQIATRELRTKIRVRDGAQIALGGLIREEEVRTLQQVPILARIPVLGELFKSRRRSTAQNELVIFLKPEIIRE